MVEYLEVTHEAMHEAISEAFRGDCNKLVGRLKTLADAVGANDSQRKAIKDMIGHIVWVDFADHFQHVLANYLLDETVETVRKK